MSPIFSQARRVIVWLGEETPDVKDALSVRPSRGFFLGPEGIPLTTPEMKPRPSNLDFTNGQRRCVSVERRSLAADKASGKTVVSAAVGSSRGSTGKNGDSTLREEESAMGRVSGYTEPAQAQGARLR